MSVILALLITILPTCQTEDSNYCHWNAEEQGNKVGTSFVVLDTNTVIHY